MGTLDARKLIELKINCINTFHMKIFQITVSCFYQNKVLSKQLNV